jgi:selenocysteine-specific elongation factor
MHVIGTAGHVDHGKSTLVKALTGIDPDRLKEERQRAMTIDLGFAWLTLPSGEEVGIVDVPGHRDFIENMLAGMPGVDFALLVIALNEGIMPQTREHLAVLDLMAVKGGIIALTKSDLVDEEGWIELVKADVRKLTAGTSMQDAPFMVLSAQTGSGIHALIEQIDLQLKNIPQRMDRSKPRLSIDRVFSMTGFGTVVTGTLLDGQLKVGDEIEILPTNLRARVRGLQTHKQKEEIAMPGARTAVNLSGLQVEQLHRGDVLIHAGTYQATSWLDVKYHQLADASTPLSHRDQVKLFIGSAEISARVKLFKNHQIKPGEEGFLRLELAKPTLALQGDRFILRRPSPPQTLGGGEVLDPYPKKYSRHFSIQAVEYLEAIKSGSADDELLQPLHRQGILPFNQLKHILQKTEVELRDILLRLLQDKRVLLIHSKNEEELSGESLVISADYLSEMISRIQSLLNAYYRQNPLRLGMKTEELNGKLLLPQNQFELLLVHIKDEGIIDLRGNLVCLPERQIQFSPKQEKSIQELKDALQKKPFETPSVEECIKVVGMEVYQSLLDQQIIIQISPEVVFEKEFYDQMAQMVISLLSKQGKITLAELRDHFQTSRKYALAVLEHLDRKGITKREGDYRRLKNGEEVQIDMRQKR